MGESASKPMRQDVLEPDIPVFDKINRETAVEYKKAFEKGGMSSLHKKVDEEIEMWRTVEVNLAVTGNSGVGKSSFINSYRGLKANSKDRAKVGVNETTMEPTKYMHPDNNNVALWDLPGVGTKKFPRETYLEKVDFETYDFFLILTATRFTENDIWLAKEVQKLQKKFLFIRTKMKIDVENEMQDSGSSKSDTVSKIRESMTQQVTEENFENVKVYLIDNRCDRDFDFPILISTLVEEAPKLKQEAMVLTMTHLTEDLINRKRNVLRKRILVVALSSAAGAAVPLPGVSLAIDTALIVREVDFYKQQFGLNDEALQKTSSSLELAVESLKKRLGSGLATLEMVSKCASTLAASELAERVTAFVLPVLGSIIAAGISYGSTVSVLRSMLDQCVSDAHIINTQLMQKMSE